MQYKQILKVVKIAEMTGRTTGKNLVDKVEEVLALWKKIICAKHVLCEEEKCQTLSQHLHSLIASWESSVDKVCRIFISSSVETEVDMLFEICDILCINEAIALPFWKVQARHFLRCQANLQSKNGWRKYSEGMWDAQPETVGQPGCVTRIK